MKNKLMPQPHRFCTTKARLAIAGSFVLLCVATALIVRTAITFGSDALPGKIVANPTPLHPSATPFSTPGSNSPVQTSPTRISIMAGTTFELKIATGVDSFVIVSPEIATGVAKDRFTVIITAVKVGETMLLARYGVRRQTYIVEVVGKPRIDVQRLNDTNGGSGNEPLSTGSFTTTYARGSDGSASLARQNIDFRRKLSKGRTLRVSGEMFKLFGGATSELAIARFQDFALNRLSVGLDTAGRTIDILDSQVNTSPLSLNSYTIRGFHLVNNQKLDVNANYQKKGLELYAGLARPSLAFFDTNGGKVAGAMIPFTTTDTLQARVGFTAVATDHNARNARGGVVVHTDAIYAPTKEISIDGETSIANGDISWRAKIDFRKAGYGGSAEVTRFARSSPLISIGGQTGGRNSELLSVYWRPAARINTSIGLDRTSVSRVNGSQFADYDRSLMFANLSFGVATASRINLRYTDQKIDTAFPGSNSKFKVETRTLSIGNTHRFGKVWSNSIEVRINFNREANANSGLETGFSLKEQLRFGWKGNSITGFLNYNRRSPSFASLIVRNPRLLPPALQAAFALDPAGFLRLNRDRIAFLLGGVELPQTRSIDTGVRFQKRFSRFTLLAETRYNGGEIFALDQKMISTSVSLSIRLDSANSIQVNGWKSVGSNGHSAVTVAYTHHFGSASNGFQLSRFFGFNRGRVMGRVFYDLNSNGKYDLFEPGVAGMSIQIDGKKKVTSDKDGTYTLQTNEGSHRLALLSNRIGVSLLASTPTDQRFDLSGGQTISLDFGVSDTGSVSGRVSDELPGLSDTAKQGGLEGVRVLLRSSDAGADRLVQERVTGRNGFYEFRDLRPGKYLVEIDATTLPSDYRIPDITTQTSIVIPLNETICDISVSGQRAVTGVIYIDTNGDGTYSPQTDKTFANAEITIGDRVVISGADGTYLFRNLPFGQTTIIAKTSGGLVSAPFIVYFGSGPEVKRKINLQVDRR